jgi:uncharacterized membrane protein YhhN
MNTAAPSTAVAAGKPASAAYAALIATAGAAAIAGSGAQSGAVWLHYLGKPLCTILILLLVWSRRPATIPAYRKAVLAGVSLSLLGDVFLMLPASVLAQGFLLGLASFLCAHLCFLFAFCRDNRLFGKPWPFLGLGLLAGVNLAVLWPGLSAAMKLPVAAYVVCLTCMAAQAMARHLTLRSAASRMTAMGGLLFMLSDTLLAYHRFYAPLPYSAVWVLGSYYAALWCIADSVQSGDLAH